MSKLQDKLDNRAVEFDRERLWERIEKPKPQKPWWSWASLVLVVGLCFCIFMFFNNKNKINSNDNVVIENIDNQKIIIEKQNENLSFDNEKTILEPSLDQTDSEVSSVLSNENIQSNDVVIQRNEIPSSTAVQQEKLTRNEQEITFEFPNKKIKNTSELVDVNDSFSSPQPPPKGEGKMEATLPKREIKMETTPPKEKADALKNFLRSKNSPPLEGEKPTNSPPLEGTEGRNSITRKKYKDIRELASKFTLIKKPKKTLTSDTYMYPISPENDPVIPLINNDSPPNRIHVQGAYGWHRNHFGEEINPELEYNKSLVKEYMSFNTALTYERKLPKIDLYGSLQYAIYQDNTKNDFIESTTYSIMSSQTYTTVETTHYDLYNDYQFLALVGGVRKEWRKGNWAFSGAIGVGANVYAYTKGNVFDGARQLVPFGDSSVQLNRRNFFGELDGGIRYYTQSGFYTHTSLTYHSRKYINHQLDNYEQKLSTVFINLGVGKAF